MWKCTIDGQVTPLYVAGDDTLTLIDPTLTMEVSRAGSFDFQIPPTHPLWGAVEAKRTIVRVQRDGAQFWSGRVSRVKRDLRNIKTVYTDGALSLLGDVALMPYTFEADERPVSALLRYYLDEYNTRVADNRKIRLGTVGLFADVPALKIVSDGYETVWEAVQKNLLSLYGGCLRIRDVSGVWTLDYMEDYAPSQQQIRWGENLVDLSEDVDGSDLYTVAVPVGKESPSGVRCTVRSVNTSANAARPGGAETMTGQQLAVNLYGYVYKKLEFDTGSPIRLRQMAEAELRGAGLNVGRTFSAVDLRDAGADVNRLDVASLIRVVSAPHGIDEAAACTKAAWKLLQPDKSVYTIGSASSSLVAQAFRQRPTARSAPAALDESRDAEANKLILSIRHRFGADKAPEETLWAANWSLFDGWPAIEGDIQWTRDGVPVLSHDQTINRLCGMEGLPDIRVDSLTLEELKQRRMKYEAGQQIPEPLPFATFEELCQLLRETSLQAWLEIKHDVGFTTAKIKKLVKMAAKYNVADRIVFFGYIQYYDFNGLDRLKTLIAESNALNVALGVGVWVGDVVSKIELDGLKALKDSATAGQKIYTMATGQSMDPTEYGKLDGYPLILYVATAGEEQVYNIIQDSPAVGIMADTVHAGRLLLERGDNR